MKTFSALLKADLLRLFGINKAFHSGKGGRKLLGIIAVSLLVLFQWKMFRHFWITTAVFMFSWAQAISNNMKQPLRICSVS